MLTHTSVLKNLQYGIHCQIRQLIDALDIFTLKLKTFALYKFLVSFFSFQFCVEHSLNIIDCLLKKSKEWPLANTHQHSPNSSSIAGYYTKMCYSTQLGQVKLGGLCIRFFLANAFKNSAIKLSFAKFVREEQPFLKFKSQILSVPK